MLKSKFGLVAILFFFLCIMSINGQENRLPLEGNSRDEAIEIENERKPQLDKLYELIRSADRIVVKYGSESEKRVLFDSSKKTDLESFISALNLEIPEEWRSSICADPYVTFFRDGKEILSIGDVSGSEVKTSVWDGNAVIADQEKWLRWFDERDMPMVRKERDHVAAAAKKDAEDEARWYAAMPSGLKEAFDKQRYRVGIPGAYDLDEMNEILEKEYPNQGDRIRALFFLYGSGSESWSSSYVYEDIAEKLLLQHNTNDLAGALELNTLTETHIEGAARLFAGQVYNRDNSIDYALIPKTLKKRLLDYALKSRDEDKIGRANKAFK